MTNISAILALFGALLSLALPASLAVGWLRGMGARPLRSVTKFLPCGAFGWALFLSALCGLVQSAATKEADVVARAGSAEPRMENGELKTGNAGVAAVGDSTALHSPLYVLHSVTTNGSHSYAMPSNAVLAEKWWRRGAYEDIHRVDLGEMRFPLGTNLCDRLWAYTWGEAWPRLSEASSRVVATGVPMSAVPGVSRFWSAVTDESATLTWQCFFLGRDTNAPVSAQLELFPSGDYTARSNEVVRSYRRVNPDDFDGDGLPNDLDGDPHHCDGDHFGPHQTLPDGANPDAYCWVDVVVSNASALVTFTGDGPSALPDPRFVARAGETYRVALLIGKAYQVTCPMPVAVVGASDPEIDVLGSGGAELFVRWPVDVLAEGLQTRGGASFAMSVSPGWLGGSFAWTNSCCSLSGSGGAFAYSCGGTCTCTGCCALGYYGYEGYRLAASGASCGCGGGDGGGEWPVEDEDGGPYAAGAGASFSKCAVIFEDRYENAPGSWVERQSTRTELRCVAHGGPNGGRARFEIAGGERLECASGFGLPVEQDVGAGMKLDFTVEYRGLQPSSAAEDIVVTATFTEGVDGAQPVSSQARLTCVKVEIVPTCLVENVPNRHCLGIRESFMIDLIPSGVNAVVSRRSGWELGSVIGTPVYTCPISSDGNGVAIHFGDALYTPQISVCEPQGILCTSGWSRCGDGFIAMQLEPYILPGNVSFSRIKMMEIPSTDGGPTGYFTNTIFEAYWHHTTNRYAGVWHRPRADNFFFEDVASFDLYCPPPLDDRSITWVIPIGWGEDDAHSFEDVVGRMATQYAQVYTLDEDGGLRIDKFGQWIKMDIQGGITHSRGITGQ